jgi:hypothetical protein
MCGSCFSADGEITFTKEALRERNLNINFLTMDRDSSVFLHSLSLLNSGNSQDVANYMEYQLDEIIIAAWTFKDEFTEKRQMQTIDFLRQIKVYRELHPRDPSTQIDPTEFSKYFGEFDPSYAERADNILESIN